MFLCHETVQQSIIILHHIYVCNNNIDIHIDSKDKNDKNYKNYNF